MRILRTEAFKEDYKRLPNTAQKKFDEKIKLFMNDIHHPSLRVKKMKGHKNRWEASIDMFYRFPFEIHRDHYFLRRIGPHALSSPNQRASHTFLWMLFSSYIGLHPAVMRTE